MPKERVNHEFTCADCGAIDHVPFEPNPGLICKECLWAEKEIRERRAPRRQHGTRVSIEITCAQCGRLETLDHMPRGKKLDELMCVECAEEALGKNSRWKRVRQQKRREQSQTWRVPCEECNRPIYLNMKPQEGRMQICNNCRFDHVPAGADATRDATPVATGVLRRRRRVVEMAPKRQEEE